MVKKEKKKAVEMNDMAVPFPFAEVGIRHILLPVTVI